MHDQKRDWFMVYMIYMVHKQMAHPPVLGKAVGGAKWVACYICSFALQICVATSSTTYCINKILLTR